MHDAQCGYRAYRLDLVASLEHEGRFEWESQALIRAARVRALAEGRAHVAFEDIRHYAAEVLQHRILLNYDGQAENVRVAELIQECLKSLSEDGGAWI